MKDKQIYTDGSCEPNPGVGGWAFVVKGDETKVHYGHLSVSTNNRAELTAMLNALIYCDDKEHVKIYSDSEYVVRGVNEWMQAWHKKGWINVKNADLWSRIYEVKRRKKHVSVNWIKGHSNNQYNIAADSFAKIGRIKKSEGIEPIE